MTDYEKNYKKTSYWNNLLDRKARAVNAIKYYKEYEMHANSQNDTEAAKIWHDMVMREKKKLHELVYFMNYIEFGQEN